MKPNAQWLRHMHPVHALMGQCYHAANLKRTEADNGNIDAQREMLAYGILWQLLLLVWDAMNDQCDKGGPEFIEAILMVTQWDLNDVQEAMYG